MEQSLSKYKISGEFSFKPDEQLSNKCNAPTNFSGIYLIFNNEKLIYIGSSGRKKNGKLITRKTGLGGLKDRIINGYHPKFGKIKRKKAFPNQMLLEGIEKLNFKWYVTYDFKNNFDFPTEIENQLLNIYKSENNTKPVWHK